MPNRLCGKDYFAWKVISVSGDVVFASDGLGINVDCNVDNEDVLKDLDIVIVCGGRRIQEKASKPLSTWLRSVEKQGVALGAICSGSFILADAGLLDGYRCSIHWEHMAALAERYPHIAVSPNIFTIDKGRYTSSGGTTPVDMMLHIIRLQCGVVEVSVSTGFISSSHFSKAYKESYGHSPSAEH